MCHHDHCDCPIVWPYEHVPGVTIACRSCNGSGEGYRPNGKSPWSVSSPDGLYDDVPCEECHASGVELCEECGDGPAVENDYSANLCAACVAQADADYQNEEN